jgi:hypothetical protein
MRDAGCSLSAPFDTERGSLLLANMLSAWLDCEPGLDATAEASDEPKDHRTAPEQTGVRLSTPVDHGPSASPSREHRAAVCSAPEGPGTGLERSCHPHPRPLPGRGHTIGSPTRWKKRLKVERSTSTPNASFRASRSPSRLSSGLCRCAHRRKRSASRESLLRRSIRPVTPRAAIRLL